jgi:hypothetical protein
MRCGRGNRAFNGAKIQLWTCNGDLSLKAPIPPIHVEKMVFCQISVYSHCGTPDFLYIFSQIKPPRCAWNTVLNLNGVSQSADHVLDGCSVPIPLL